MPKTKEKVYMVGAVVHDVVEVWCKAGYPAGFVQNRIVPAFTEHMHKERINIHQDELAELLRRTVRGALATEILYRKLQFPEHNAIVEPRFKVPFGSGHNIIGGYDVYDPTREACFDLKLSEQGDHELEQLLTYAVALKRSGYPIKWAAFLYPLRRKQLQTFRLTDQMLDDHERTLLRTIDTVLDGFNPEPSPGFHCVLYCDYWRTSNCPATLAMRETPERVPGQGKAYRQAFN